VSSNSKSKLRRLFSDKELRHEFVRQQVAANIALQLRALRKARKWRQVDLEEKHGIRQNLVSRYEKMDYGKHELETLLRLAAAYDVGLDVQFIPFSRVLRNESTIGVRAVAPTPYEEEISAPDRQPVATTVSADPVVIHNVVVQMTSHTRYKLVVETTTKTEYPAEKARAKPQQMELEKLWQVAEETKGQMYA
jgi:transcriptional regulator with XRE-family HTH domain